VEGVFRASRAFDEPFSTLKRCREELQAMHRARLLGRTAIPDTGRGQKPYAYHLVRGAQTLAPEVADIPKSNSVFHGLGKNPFHALAASDFWSLFEFSASNHIAVRVLERLRDRQFVAPLNGHSKLEPDGTVLLEINGRRKFVFLELVNETSVINPGTSASRERSLAGKLAKYRAFRGEGKNHPIWHRLEKVYGAIGGFQVLVVTTRGNCQYLLTAAEGSRSMFLFGELAELRSSCVFEDSVWWFPRSAWRPKGPERTCLLGQ
jgi:hypothetical protein